MSKPTNTVHMDLLLAAEVRAGRVKATTPVGFIRYANGAFDTLFAAFEPDGSPVESDKGNAKFNGRPQ